MYELDLKDTGRVNSILKNKKYIHLMSRIAELEKEREFCLHDLNHSLDVARIGYIISLEEDLKVSRELIYAAALLHDIGRADEYEKKLSHHEQSAVLAEAILTECGFKESEKCAICEAISAHKYVAGDERGLKYILYRADKLSRKCFDCKMYQECYWDENKKNQGILR
jgi:putative nucleotidyltransferase with HDIG domain